MSDPQSVEKTESTVPAAPAQNQLLRQLLSSNPLLIFLSCVLAFALSSVLIVLANEDARQAAGYFFARPGDFLSAAWGAVVDALTALVRGAIFDWTKDNPQQMLRPLTESLTNAVPLILAGLGLAVGFRAGLFNIGAQGQLLAGATLATWVSLHTTLPAVVALPLALLAAATGGALWASIAGVLKARTGANEVIVTIMLNSIAFFGVQYLLTKDTFIGEGNSNPKSLPIPEAAQYPRLLGDSFRLHWGFLVALAAAVAVWWLLERSTWGFEFRATGFNPHAARTAGISVNRVTVAVMAVAGALAGLAGTAPILATEKALTDGVAGSYGFDAITVALLGRSRPWGTVMAGILFGALRAGGTLMQTATKTPIDIVLVVQSIIVLLIAAPPLVRMIFRLPAPEPKRQEVAA
ncbi:ABC transporter permease [Buchananella hordeovulneris]|uniref:ABC transporter permease n=1 Tax=Buchananella hordeovulneris TaxID=52770 RepID=A0A1Q5PZG3_9ACTO|nr:ABC transporter permease [Buchananella hordeovulneris]MDO5080754.1 ABC transporter permease [Buchananella hordeovulneris]OKL52835.1 ABC transporter permease [Buchananella hordeovulneris]RRD43578.1 ABC transporter permease [Buchananella hordeovulneris]